MNVENPRADYHSQQQKREYFRLVYPHEFRPVLMCRGQEYQVVNLSEYGVSFRVDDSEDFNLGQELVADIVFHDQQHFGCRGEIIRLAGNRVALSLSLPIPLYKIRSENIFLIGRFARI